MSEIIKNRYEFVLLYDVENGNPNGDPDMGNMPRIDPQTGHGIVTDVCLKRKIRDYVSIVKDNVPGYSIYVRSGISLNSQHETAEEALLLSKKEKKDDSKITIPILKKYMCDNYYDIRTFGAVMTTGKVNCGQVRGPVQLNFSRSIDPIFSQEISITRLTVTKTEELLKDEEYLQKEVNKEKQEEKKKKKVTEFGDKFIVPYALYRAEGYVSANLAEKVTGFSEEDLDLLWESLVNMFEHDHSAARGKMAARKLIVFKHDSKLGCCQSHVLFDKIKVEKTKENLPPRSYNDYQVTIERDVPTGVELIEKL